MTAVEDNLLSIVVLVIGLGALIWLIWDYKRGGGY